MNKNEFTPKQWVLVRDEDTAKWKLDIYSHFNERASCYGHICVGGGYSQCISYEGNEALLNKTDEHVEPFTAEDGDFLFVRTKEDKDYIFIKREGNEMTTCYCCYSYETDDLGFNPCVVQDKKIKEIREAGEEEKIILHQKLYQIMKTWNAEKKTFDIRMPYDGEFVTYIYREVEKEHVFVTIARENERVPFSYHVAVELTNEGDGIPNFDSRMQNSFHGWRPSTEAEKNHLFRSMHNIKTDWDDIMKEITPYRWEPEVGKPYWAITDDGEAVARRNEDSEEDKKRIAVGNCFECEASCRQYAEKYRKILIEY